VTNILGADDLSNTTLIWLPCDGSDTVILGGRGFHIDGENRSSREEENDRLPLWVFLLDDHDRLLKKGCFVSLKY